MAIVSDTFRSSLTLIIVVSFVIMFIRKVNSAATESEALLKLKQSFTGQEALVSWKTETLPCDKKNPWVGVICLNNGMVAGLRLDQMSLSGKIDVEALIQIPGIRSLSISFNNFSGQIPEFNRLGALKAIYLTGNQFSGEIPHDYFVKMESLKKLWLSTNRFSGQIPLSLGQLPHLIELHLEGNQFSGIIPPLEQPTLMSLDLSNNNLRGEIPRSLSRFNMSSFQGNPGLCGEKVGLLCRGTPVDAFTNNKDLEDDSKMIAYGFLVASSVMLLLMVCGIYALRRRQESESTTLKEKESALEDSIVGVKILSTSKKELSESKKRFGSIRKASNKVGDLVMVNEKKGEFGLADLMKAAAEVLANGTIGSCYKASMTNGLTVVVKRIKEVNRIGKDVFDAEIKRFGRLKHKNVLTPLAYHFRRDEKLLVCEYMPKGCLLHQLHADRGASHAELNWPARLKIIQGIAQGLGYLHTQLSSLEIPHGNLKSSNVLLSLENDALLVDYGYTSLISNKAKQSLFAYKSPEILVQQQQQVVALSPKCDVYCLGIIILEVMTGKFPTQYLGTGTGGTDVVQWAKSAVAEGRESELFDPEMASSGSYLTGEMEKLLHIGVACTENNPDQRLEISEAIRRIQEIQVLIEKSNNNISDSSNNRSFQVLPSLRDGYADSVVPVAPTDNSNAPQSYNTINIGNVPGNRNNSFTFEAS
ncbi:OLC1v1015179C1 [Oldenlandia corymbosa var. corymbosa]|uniref:OLC1v1015179C1 n=1 Tax=Oldenlandia corymbosa var. corymbosa TaxID=529605 RepID=A0AAV1E692_OLDCO|nr:OLC1v1015179C1 [Oldenlandia corymbosa var. corymbosa]